MQRAPSAPNFSAFTVATPEISPSAGVFLMRSSTLRRRRWRGDRKRAVFDERAVIDELRDVFPRRALIGLAPALDRRRPVFIERNGVARDQFGEIGADVIEIDILFLRRRHGHRSRPARETGSPRPASGSRRHPAAIFVTLPPCGAVTRCSIFMDSSTAICWPGRTSSPSLTSMATMVPCSGAGTGDRAGRTGRRFRRRSETRHGIARVPTSSGAASSFAGVATSAATCVSMKPVLMRLAMKSGCASTAREERNVGGDAADAELAQGARGLLHHVGPVRAGRMHDDLGEQRVEGRAGLVAGIAERIDADAGAGRQIEQRRACRRSAWSRRSRPSSPC